MLLRRTRLVRHDRINHSRQLMVLDVVKQDNVDIMLARETFDSKMAPLKAWVAQMELEGMRERMTMGVKARLRAGKANTGQDRYGYRRVGDHIEIVERLQGFDAVIAAGSNNNARYFEYYFRDIPHIIRKNRNGVAVLTGQESEKELAGIGKDIFTYFGMGCRNVTKLYIPREYDLKILLGVLDRYHPLYQHNKYANNVDYYRTMYLMNQASLLDNEVLLLKEDSAIASPVGVVFYERYSEIRWVEERLASRNEEIQCVVSVHPEIEGAIPPGSTQEPMPWDYADGVDTIKFLNELD